jgi:hypothetical protein
MANALAFPVEEVTNGNGVDQAHTKTPNKPVTVVKRNSIVPATRVQPVSSKKDKNLTYLPLDHVANTTAGTVLVHVQQTLRLPREHVFRVLANHGNYANMCSHIKSSKLLKAGYIDQNGVGAERLLNNQILQQITAYKFPCHFAFKTLSGLPYKTFNGQVVLRDGPPGETVVEYTVIAEGGSSCMSCLGWSKSNREKAFVTKLLGSITRLSGDNADDM